MPVVFLFMSATMSSLDTSLEEIARVTGASPVRVLCTVIIPILLPSLLSCALICAVHSIESYAVPAVLGTSAGIDLLSTRIALDLAMTPPAYGTASASAILLMSVAIFGTIAYSYATRVQQRFITVSGKAANKPQPLRGWRMYLGLGLAWSYIVLSVVLPIGVIVLASFQSYWGQPISKFSPTLDNYKYIFNLPNFVPALKNTLFLSTVGPTLTVALGFVLAYASLRGKTPLRVIIDKIAIIPHAIPGLVIGLALMWTYLFLPVPFYGTIWILLVALITRFTPYANRPLHAMLLQLNPELEEASRTAGAGWWRTFSRILAPLALPSLVSSWLLLYVVFIREISTIILIYTFSTISIPIFLFNIFFEGHYSEGAALTIIQLLLMLFGWVLLSRYIKPIYMRRTNGN
jgi:iron(III) transport system permease protein